MTLNDLPQLTLAAAGTAQLIIPEGELEVAALIITADADNTGDVVICSEDGGMTRFIRRISPGKVASISAIWYDPNIGLENFLLKVHELYFDGETTGNKINVGYMKS